MSEILLSVIIPVRDDPDRLRLCLAALARQSLPHAAFEVIVVDNGPSEAVRAAAESVPGVRYAAEPRAGSYAARNCGLALARAPFFAFTDADCIPAPDWLERGLAVLRADPAPGLVAGRIDVFAADSRRPTAVECFERVAAFPQDQFVARWHFGATANVFTARSVVEAVGPFNPELTSGGDLEWGQRVHASGRPVVHAPDAAVAHPARRTLAELREKEERVVKGAVRLAGAPTGWKRLALDLAYDWPRPGELWALAADSRLHGIRERLRVLALALWVKGLRIRVRLAAFRARRPGR